MKIIIPAAGFGTRMHMKPNESKELLKTSDGRYRLIEQALMLPYPQHVITRKEKQDLISYMEPMHLRKDVSLQIIESSREWAHTMLLSKDYWDEKNLLVLPDVEITPLLESARALESVLDRVDVAVATHVVDDVSKWGQVRYGQIIEKPSCQEPGIAWGLLAFRKDIGESLFTAMLEKQSFQCKMGYVDLIKYSDNTRG